MVHNGIEYGDMQLIAEVYDLLHRGAGLSNPAIAAIFASWNEQELRSYLVEITANILAHTDEETGESLVDLILDEAAQKGTGKWTSQTSLDVGAAVPTIHSAVQSRLLSSLKGERRAAAHLYGTPHLPAGKVGDVGDVASLVAAARDALYASKVTAYAQGLSLLRAAAQEYGWNLDLAAIVRVWRAGCIIRAGLLDDIAAAFSRDPDLPNLLLDPHFARAIRAREANWRCVVQTAVKLRIPLLAIGASLSYFDSYRSERLPANLIQAQRDYFGAHTYRRTDRAGVFHTDWEAPAHKTAAASPAPALARA
jgi:6-phosphogluconate dehydrogenase